MRRIGIDVGGTNTDAVLLEGGQVSHAGKIPTTADVTAGTVTALAELAGHLDAAHGAIDGVVIGQRASSTPSFSAAISLGWQRCASGYRRAPCCRRSATGRRIRRFGQRRGVHARRRARLRWQADRAI
jgi:hypothetical protein